MIFRELTGSDFEAFLEYKVDFEEKYSFPEVLDKSSFEDLIRSLEKMKNGIDLKPGRVPGTTFFYRTDENEFIGRLNYRKDLTPEMCIEGGNIGYEIRMSYRNKGFGTLMLKDFLKWYNFGDQSRVLLTCLENNIASENVILKNGGIFDTCEISPRSGLPTKRFWLAV